MILRSVKQAVSISERGFTKAKQYRTAAKSRHWSIFGLPGSESKFICFKYFPADDFSKSNKYASSFYAQIAEGDRHKKQVLRNGKIGHGKCLWYRTLHHSMQGFDSLCLLLNQRDNSYIEYFLSIEEGL